MPQVGPCRGPVMPEVGPPWGVVMPEVSPRGYRARATVETTLHCAHMLQAKPTVEG